MVVTEVIWGSRFRIHHRVADTYRAGRLLLAGDAAHVHSPAGGQGMNLGIQDAVALSEALASVLDGGPDSLLDEYSAARRPIARDVVTMTDRLTRLATLPRVARPLRNAVFSVVGRIPAANRALAWRLSGPSTAERADFVEECESVGLGSRRHGLYGTRSSYRYSVEIGVPSACAASSLRRRSTRRILPEMVFGSS